MADEALEEVVEVMVGAAIREVARIAGGELAYQMALKADPHDFEGYAEFRQQMMAALAAAEALGFKLVGRRPCKLVADAGKTMAFKHIVQDRFSESSVGEVWRAMWDAAPSARKTEGGAR